MFAYEKNYFYFQPQDYCSMEFSHVKLDILCTQKMQSVVHLSSPHLALLRFTTTWMENNDKPIPLLIFMLIK